MKSDDLGLIYEQSILIPRRVSGRADRLKALAFKTVNDYIENGSVGDLDMTFCVDGVLPDGLTVNGDLNLQYTTITTLPDNLTVNGSIECSSTSLKSLPQGLVVTGDLWLRYTPVLMGWRESHQSKSGKIVVITGDEEKIPELANVQGSVHF